MYEKNSNGYRQETHTLTDDEIKELFTMKKCPLRGVLKTYYTVAGKEQTIIPLRCYSIRCALYDKAAHCCAILAIARALRDNK